MLDRLDVPFDPLRLMVAGRVHEVMGPAARVIAARLAGALSGPVLWVQEARAGVRLCPQGLVEFFDPARLVMARPGDRLGVLQVMEEALRSGAVPLVVAELARAPDLTESRRLQLAAGAGAGRGLVVLTGTAAEANAAETRWIATPLRGGGQRAERVKNKRGGLGEWEMR